jgi:hypothetical protein
MGIKLYLMLEMSSTIKVVAVCFFATLAASAAGTEIFYRMVEIPSQALSHVAYDWIRE